MKTWTRNKMVANVALVMTSALLVGCNNGSKGNDNNQGGLLADVNYTFPVSQFNATGEQCNFIGGLSYQCSEVIVNGSRQSTAIISFTSKQDLCVKLSDNNFNGSFNSVVVNGVPYQIARNVRASYVSTNCNGIQNNFPGTGTGLSSNGILKTASCRLAVETADGAMGDSGDILFPVASGSASGLVAVMDKVREGRIFSWRTSPPSTRYVTAKWKYIGARGSEADQMELTLKSKSSNQSATITGFAGQNVSLVMENAGDVLRAEINCIVSDATNRGSVRAADGNISCKANSSDKSVERENLIVSSSELSSGAGVSFLGDRSDNVVTLTAEGSEAVYTSVNNGRLSTQFIGRAHLSSRTIFKSNIISATNSVDCR